MAPFLHGVVAPKTLFGFFLSGCIAGLPAFVHSATANSVTLQWAANSESDLGGYRIYQGTTTGSYGPSLDVGNVTTFTVSNLQKGRTYYFAITAYDLSGNESAPSDEVSKQFLVTAPAVASPPVIPLNVTPSAISPTSRSTRPAVSEPLNVTLATSDNTGVPSVQFLSNGTDRKTEDALRRDQHTLSAVSRDSAGMTTTSEPANVKTRSPTSTLSLSVAGNGGHLRDGSSRACPGNRECVIRR